MRKEEEEINTQTTRGDGVFNPPVGVFSEDPVFCFFPEAPHAYAAHHIFVLRTSPARGGSNANNRLPICSC